MTVPRRQHSVWRSYLEAWASDKKIFCLQDGKIFRANVANVAVQRDFYRLHTLTAADIKFIRLFFRGSPTVVQPVLENFIAMFGWAGRIKELLSSSEAAASDLERYMITAEEDFHARLEGGIKPIFDAIRNSDLSFYQDPNLCGQFTHFLSLQHLRTKGVRERIFARELERQPRGEFSVERCWNIISHVSAVNAGARLLIERARRPLILLENDTGTPFLTGDQPTVNLLSPPPGGIPQLLAFYYPVSPRLAIILDEAAGPTGFRSGQVSVKQVKELNGKIRDAAHRQIFGSSRAALSR